jgi:uncharacterized delta-60 repeat protein/gliding motility-associated-like protein
MKGLVTQLIFAIALLLSIKAYSQDGSLDGSFNVGTGTNNNVYTTAIQNDGKVIIGGIFTSYNGTATSCIVRLNTDGSLDASFNVGNGDICSGSAYIRTIAIQSDGKIIIGGNFSLCNGTGKSNIVRLNTDGSLDASFNVGGNGSNGTVYTISIQSDGKIIIGGDFFSYNLISRNHIARLNTNGSLDYSFNIGLGANSIVGITAIQDDGKIIIAGSFTSYQTTIINRIARLNTDGSLDASFNVGTGSDDFISTIAIQDDGKIIIGGRFYLYNSIAINHIARLNIDGSLDATFNIGTGATAGIFVGSVETIAIQEDGKIIIGGFFTMYNGIAINRIARLNTDGSLDASFNVGTGTDNVVFSAVIQIDGKIIIGGAFTEYNGTSRNCVARIMGTCINSNNYEIISSSTCFSDNTQFSFSHIIGYDSLRWDFNDPISGTLNSATDFNPVHQFTSPGSYNISVTVYSCNSSNTVYKQIMIKPIPSVNLGNDTLLCTGDSLELNATLGFSQYLWSNNSTSDYINVKTSGNYWVLVTDNGCKNSDTVNINYINYPTINLGNDTTFCIDTIYTLNPDNNNSLMYLWSDSTILSSMTVINSGTYWVRASNGYCINSDTITLIFDDSKNMMINASKDTVDYLEGVQFTASGNNMLSYKWNFNDGTFTDIQNPYHTFMESGNYNVTIEGTNINNCVATKNLPIVVREILFIPNLFTPNNDNLNDDFKIIYNGKEEYLLEIYNRWGEQVFISNNKSNHWDGKNSADGIYYYSLAIGSKAYKGWVHLLK